MFRAGVWRPRTKPVASEVMVKALPWMEAGKRLGMLISAGSSHSSIELAMKYDMDILYRLGARTSC